MKLRVTLTKPDNPQARDDLTIEADAGTTVAQLATFLVRAKPTTSKSAGQGEAARTGGNGAMTLARRDSGASRPIPGNAPLSESGLQSGAVLALVPDHSGLVAAVPRTAAVLTILSGPDSGREIALDRGSWTIGRSPSADIRLPDPLVSKLHARLTIADTIELTDLNSSNGVIVAGQTVTRTVMQPEDEALLGDTVIRITPSHAGAGAPTVPTAVAFNRSPQRLAAHPGNAFAAPEPPSRRESQRFPAIALLAPMLMGGALFLVTHSALSLMFIALSPILMVGQWAESRISGNRAFARESQAFRDDLNAAVTQVRAAQVGEVEVRLAESPSGADLENAVAKLTPLVWARRPDSPRWAQVRFGLGRQPARNTLQCPAANRTTAQLWGELTAQAQSVAEVADVPVVGDFSASALGVAGPNPIALASARSLVLQMTGLHSPAELTLAVITSTANIRDWDWVRWLPHVGSEASPLRKHHLVSTEPTGNALLAELEALLAERSADSLSRTSGPTLPAVLVVIDDDSPVQRSRLVSLAERGAAVGVHVLWVAQSVNRLPAACKAWLDLASTDRAAACRSSDGAAIPVIPDLVTEGSAERFARLLAPIVDSGAGLNLDQDLPSSVSLLALGDQPAQATSAWVLERWRETQSLPNGDRTPLAKDHTLRALVGAGPDGAMNLDLREHGPHALVGGTTGSGKSEFLQTWVLSMAAAHSPLRVTFLLVDYKGGAAFAECANLPHTVGLVTDLSPHRVRRALISLQAEIRHREELLQHHGRAKDLLALERTRNPAAPPSLVIVIDEFAALVKEVPEFVDGVADVAQRGRSLGLHLILATQRPAGVIRESLRTNTNLRVALRMNDESDSHDVIGTAAAAGFDPAIPGRGVVRVGPGRLLPFQSAYVGGRTASGPTVPAVTVETLSWDVASKWELPRAADAPETPDLGPTDIASMVAAIQGAAEAADVPQPRKPWLPTLPAILDLGDLRAPEPPPGKSETALVFGKLDDPSHQDQPVVSFLPDRDGAMAVYGTGGTGKSTLLRTLASSAARACVEGDRTEVYALDFGTGALSSLQQLPNVASVIRGDDHERIGRLVAFLKSLIDERSRAFAAVHASSLNHYRDLAAAPDTPRVLVLVDAIGTFWQDYQEVRRIGVFEDFTGIVLEGRAVGVHVVMTADRPAAIPSHIASSVQRRVILRQANDTDAALLGLPADLLNLQTPAGRGVVDGLEVQVGVLGDSADTTEQARALEAQATQLRRAGVAPAKPVGHMPERVVVTDLPASVNGEPALGISQSDLAPVTIKARGSFVITGPSNSGVPACAAGLLQSLVRWNPNVQLTHLGAAAGGLTSMAQFEISVTNRDKVDLLRDLANPMSDARLDDRLPVLVIEDVAKCIEVFSDSTVNELVKLVTGLGGFVVATGDLASLEGCKFQPTFKSIQASRSGLILAPDQFDGDLVKTQFPRVNSTEFPPGRGILAREGRPTIIQAAFAD